MKLGPEGLLLLQKRDQHLQKRDQQLQLQPGSSSKLPELLLETCPQPWLLQLVLLQLVGQLTGMGLGPSRLRQGLQTASWTVPP